MVVILVCCRFRESYRSPKCISSCEGEGCGEDEEECQRTISAD